MSIAIKEDTDLVYNRSYKVCYYADGRKDKIGTFTNKLTNADNTYFWFSSVEYGLAVIRQDMVVYMGCVDEPKKIENICKTIYYYSFSEVYNFDIFKTYFDLFVKSVNRNPIVIKANIETLKNIFPEFTVKPLCYNLYRGCKMFTNNSLPIGKIFIR